MADSKKLCPRTGDTQTIYPKNATTSPDIVVNDYTAYNGFIGNPVRFEQSNVPRHYPIDHDRLLIGESCPIIYGVKFSFNNANRTVDLLSTYPFPLFLEEWEPGKEDVTRSWDNKGDIIIGNDVWIGYGTVILAGVTTGNGAIIGARAVVTKDVPSYTIIGGVPTRSTKKRFDNKTISELLDIQWWDWTGETITQNIKAIQSGNMEQISRRIRSCVRDLSIMELIRLQDLILI